MTEPGGNPLLSILIPTMVKREHLFLSLLDNLLPQAEKAPAPVEVIGLQNAGEQPLAAYRDQLLHAARGEFLAFIDDDDLVSTRYTEMILTALFEHNPDVVTFPQFCTGTACPVTYFGLGYLGAPWEPVLMDGMPAYLRPFSHILPARTELALRCSFTRDDLPGHTMEDQAFAQAMVPLLMDRGAREARVQTPLYCYCYGRAGESTQDGPQAGGRDGAHERPVIESPCFRWYGA